MDKNIKLVVNGKELNIHKGLEVEMFLKVLASFKVHGPDDDVDEAMLVEGMITHILVN